MKILKKLPRDFSSAAVSLSEAGDILRAPTKIPTPTEIPPMKTSSLKSAVLAVALVAVNLPLLAGSTDTSKGARGNTSFGTPSLDNTQSGQSFSVYCPMMKTESVVTVASVDGKGRATSIQHGTRFAPGSCSFVLVRAGSGKETHMEMACKTGGATVACKVMPCH